MASVWLRAYNAGSWVYENLVRPFKTGHHYKEWQIHELTMNLRREQRALDEKLTKLAQHKSDEINRGVAQRTALILKAIRDIRDDLRQRGEYKIADAIRDALNRAGIEIKDDRIEPAKERQDVLNPVQDNPDAIEGHR